ncbi:hypothetical protein BS78_10G264300 [Paspalum vaginatum]|nr:hypothetical protein BS78_10G264300 [Paspalum vaginatum]
MSPALSKKESRPAGHPPPHTARDREQSSGMRAPASLLLQNLHAAELQASAAPAAPPPPPADADQQQATVPVDSDMVVILASFLCALVCVLGLALVSRCACRRFVVADPTQRQQQQASPQPPPPPRGLKKKAIDALPTVSFTAASPSPAASAGAAAASSSSECAICLADFAEGEALRVLPRCGHGFHVACVDAWLRTRATCPSCRAAIVAQAQAKVVAPAAACERCGQVLQRPPPAPGPGPAQAQPPSSAAAAAAGDYYHDTFLP